MRKSQGNVGIIVAVVLALVAGLFFFAPNPTIKKGMETITELEATMEQKDESVKTDNDNFRAPIWASYHKKTNPGFVDRKLSNVLSLSGLKGRPAWSPNYFTYMVDTLLDQRTKAGYKHPYVLRISPSEKSRFIVWGDLGGAFHSLGRAVKKLVSLKVLDENLKLTSPDDYIVFQGDTSNRSPFIMETLSLIFTLIRKNPKRVVYIQGSDEHKGAWHRYGLQEEFNFKAGHLIGRDALTKKLDDLFMTLPLALYVSVPPHANNDFVRFCHYGLAAPSAERYKALVELLDDRYYSKELLTARKPGEWTIIPIKKESGDVDPNPVTVRATVKSFKKSKHYRPTQGLHLLMPDREATAWSFISCPTVLVAKVVKYYNDAFGIIQTAPKVEDWTITLYHHDRRKPKEDFKTVGYNFISGQNLSSGEKLTPKAPFVKKKK